MRTTCSLKWRILLLVRQYDLTPESVNRVIYIQKQVKFYCQASSWLSSFNFEYQTSIIQLILSWTLVYLRILIKDEVTTGGSEPALSKFWRNFGADVFCRISGKRYRRGCHFFPSLSIGNFNRKSEAWTILSRGRFKCFSIIESPSENEINECEGVRDVGCRAFFHFLHRPPLFNVHLTRWKR